MAKSALIIGGSGQIGRATAAALAGQGWQVTATHRDGPAPSMTDLAWLVFDRDEPGALARLTARGFDAVIDTVAFDDRHAGQLLEIQDDVGAFVVVSSASVYCDDRGRSLDEARGGGFPYLPEPIAETQATVTPGPETYSTRKVALEQALLQGARRPVVILRPCAIHGPGSRAPREWFFVKRILDGRTIAPLAFNGESRFHTSATANIAALVGVALRDPATAVLNAADPEALSARAIGEAISALYGGALKIAPFEGPPVDGVGSHPWCTPRPFVLDMTAAAALGYQPITDYLGAVGASARGAEASAAAGVAFAPYLATMFDYAGEDIFLSR